MANVCTAQQRPQTIPESPRPVNAGMPHFLIRQERNAASGHNQDQLARGCWGAEKDRMETQVRLCIPAYLSLANILRSIRDFTRGIAHVHRHRANLLPRLHGYRRFRNVTIELL